MKECKPNNVFEENLQRLLRSCVKSADPIFERNLIKSVLGEVARERRRDEATGTLSIWGTITRSRITKRAVAMAAVAFVITVLVVINRGNRGPTIAFAEVLAQIRTFRPYSCTYTTQYEGKPAYTYRVMRLSLSRRREIRPDGRILVFDLSVAPIKALILDPEGKFAIETTYVGSAPARDPDILTMVSKMQDGHAQDLGMRDVDGQLAQGFHVRSEMSDYTVWADPETRLPVRIEILQKHVGKKLIFSDFEFDVDFDESLFSTTAPEGYTVEEVEEDRHRLNRTE